MLFRKKKSQSPDAYRLFYASDVHGSQLAWRKFLSAAKVYDAAALIMGGDLTGKAIVPIVAGPDGYLAEFQGRRQQLDDDRSVAEFEDAVRTNGFYPYRCDRATYEELKGDPERVTELFNGLMEDELREWIRLADKRLAGSGVTVFAMPGNDDEFTLDEIIAGESVVNCDGRMVEVGPYQMYSLSWATTTPWDTPRETTEEGMWEKIEALVEGVADFERAIFNFHVPPYDSGLDLGPALTADLEVIKEAGQAKQVPIGSHSVRRAIETFQPLLALHGHVHESRGITEIGRTVCINPGSRYAEGVVDGALVNLDGAEVASRQIVAG